MENIKKYTTVNAFCREMQDEMREFECGLDSYIRQNETARCNY